LRDVFLQYKKNRITVDLELAVNELESLAAGNMGSGHQNSPPAVEA
jgi:hypothetical protein